MRDEIKNALVTLEPVDSASGCTDSASAARFAKGELSLSETVGVTPMNGVRYALPQKVHRGEGKVKLYFRVDKVYRGRSVVVTCGGEVVKRKKTLVMAPGEMQNIEIDKSLVKGEISIYTEE